MELESRREVGLLISNPTVTRQIMQVFEADWASASAKDGGKVLTKTKNENKSKNETAVTAAA